MRICTTRRLRLGPKAGGRSHSGLDVRHSTRQPQTDVEDNGSVERMVTIDVLVDVPSRQGVGAPYDTTTHFEDTWGAFSDPSTAPRSMVRIPPRNRSQILEKISSVNKVQTFEYNDEEEPVNHLWTPKFILKIIMRTFRTFRVWEYNYFLLHYYYRGNIRKFWRILSFFTRLLFSEVRKEREQT